MYTFVTAYRNYLKKMKIRNIVLVLAAGLGCMSAGAVESDAADSVFTKLISGVSITFTIQNDSNRTVFIGNGHDAAITAAYSDALTIPAAVRQNDSIYTVAGIADSAFYACRLSAIELPKDLGSIGCGAFKLCENLRRVTLKAEHAFDVGVEAFDSIAAECVLYVPEGTLGAYARAGWTSDVFGGGLVETNHDTVNYSVENGIVSEYLQKVVYPDSNYSFTRITSYAYKVTSYKKNLPWPVRIEVPVAHGGRALVAEIFRDSLPVRSDTFIVGQKFLDLWNLVPQCDYTYRVCLIDTVGENSLLSEGAFTTEGQVRMMNIDGMQNFRDLGGWPLPGGGHVRYDRLFRSEELYYEPMNYFITPAGIHELLHVQGIDAEIDFSDDRDYSPVADYLDHIHGSDYQVLQYIRGLNETPFRYKNCFEKVVELLRQDKKVLFHCTYGADRTGTFAFMLLGLLGATESDVAKDYELTNFFRPSIRCYRNDSQRYRALVDTIKVRYAGETLQEKIEQMALSFGIKQSDIDDFRALMTVAPPADSTGTVKCATPLISYDRGLLRFACATPGAQFLSKVTVADAQESSEAEIRLTACYEVTVRAVAEGYADSDVVTATLRWSDGGLVVDNVTVVATNDVRIETGDVNNDGTVGIGDIVAITNIMAGTVQEESPTGETEEDE